jgi:hypothetical protein
VQHHAWFGFQNAAVRVEGDDPRRASHVGQRSGIVVAGVAIGAAIAERQK